MAELFTNDAITTLAAPCGSGDATITVASATGFPGSGNFRLRVDNEILLVTAVSGVTFTVSRAVEAVAGVTAAAAHSSGATVEHVFTAGSVQNVVGPTGATGATGAAGPNSVSTATTTTLTGLLEGNGSNVGAVTIGTGLSYSGGTLTATGAGGATTGVDVASFATAGTGSQGSPWTGWDTAITWTAFTRYLFRSGYFAFSTSPNYLQPGIEIIGSPGTYLVHTGTGDAFVMDAGSVQGSNWIENVRVENIIVYGSPTLLTGTLAISNNATACVGTGTAFTTQVAVGDSITFAYGAGTARSYIVTVVTDNTHLTINRVATQAESGNAKGTHTQRGFYLRGVRNGVFDRCAAHDVAVAAFWTEACVTNCLRMFRCTYNEPTQATNFQCRPQYGIVTSSRGADLSTCWAIENPVIEGMQIYGIWFTSNSYGNTVVNGTSEGNESPAVGVQVDGTLNVFLNIDVEANSSGTDLAVTGSDNTFINIVSTTLTTTSTAGVSSVQFIGGRYNNLTLGSSSSRCAVYAAVVSGTFTDSGSGNLYLTRTGADLRSQAGIPVPQGTSPSGTAPAANAFQTNFVLVDVPSACTVPAPTNPINGLSITYRFDNNSGSSQTISWNGIFQSLTGFTLPTTISNTGTIFVTVYYSSFWGKWQCVNVAGS